MKNCPHLARLAAAQGCAREVNATSVEVRAIACSSMDIRAQCDKMGRSGGKVTVRDSGSANHPVASFSLSLDVSAPHRITATAHASGE